MFLAKRKVKGTQYYYLEEMAKQKRISVFIGNKENLNKNIANAFEEVKRKTILEQAQTTFKKFKPKTLSVLELIELETLKYNYQLFKTFFSESFSSFDEDEFVRYAQGSTSVEGNSVSLQEASIILTKNASSSGKNIDEIKEVQNMKKTQQVSEKKPKITERLLKKIHAVIMDGFPDKGPGRYRSGPMFITGSKIRPPNAETAVKEAKKLMDWFKENKEKMHPVELAAVFHVKFEEIHPFSDGNGRTGREIMNLILQEKGYPRTIINLENRESYIILLERLQLSKQYIQFSKFIYTCLQKRAQEIQLAIEENKQEIFKQLMKKK
ncbi:MAG: Fic family protein [Candidatus Diapherotrites archaeon]|nr:Fic family protein [Candidatus Diapherotrites archaeon]